MCKHCAARAKKALEAVAGVAEADVSPEHGQAVLTLNAGVDDAAIIAAVAEAGYEVTGVA